MFYECHHEVLEELMKLTMLGDQSRVTMQVDKEINIVFFLQILPYIRRYTLVYRKEESTFDSDS